MPVPQTAAVGQFKLFHLFTIPYNRDYEQMGGLMMKKYLVGALIGALIATAATASAAEIKSMIGKKVEGVRKIEVNGQKLSKDVIIIEGTSYAPVRVFAEAIGFDVGLTDNAVTLKGKVSENMDEAETRERLAISIEAETTLRAAQTKLQSDEEKIISAKKRVEQQNERIGNFDILLPFDSAAQPEIDFTARRDELIVRLNELTFEYESLVASIAKGKEDIAILQAEFDAIKLE